MKKYKSLAAIEAAIVSGKISTTPQLRKALALLDKHTAGVSSVSEAIHTDFNDMRKASVARRHHLLKR